ncbi:Hypothetical protein PHPALM_14249 [Phytophthora palmivora]|uniref:Tc1-like transposase DDE domain-containing protein n=1 Tax=Phytophthora palmivora TaxID=4796 RepID=A0A2P4XV69_9STRA|nr:Hypothetical protein PHPALM_14249 [Phytophthora palmivora]
MRFNFGVELSTSTISNKLIGKLYTIKQVHVEPITCNNDANKAKRMVFAKESRQHMQDGNSSCITMRPISTCTVSIAKDAPKEASEPPYCCFRPRVKCAVSTELGLVHYRLQCGSILMDVNASFVDEIYGKAKLSSIFQEHFIEKIVVVVLDNAPAHNQTENLITERDDMVLLRLALYSPMCNPIQVMARPRGMFAVARMEILERAAKHCIGCMDMLLVTRITLHYQHDVAAAERMEDIEYGT